MSSRTTRLLRLAVVLLVFVTGLGGPLCAAACSMGSDGDFAGSLVGSELVGLSPASPSPISDCHGQREATEPGEGRRGREQPARHECELGCEASALMRGGEILRGYQDIAPDGIAAIHGPVEGVTPVSEFRLSSRLDEHGPPHCRDILLLKSSLQI